ncbi:MAG TPA: IS3 family transposase [Anaerolineaceae bacterium]
MIGTGKWHVAVEQVRKELDVSEWLASRVIRQARSTQRRKPEERNDEEQLRQEVVKMTSKFGCYGYRLVMGLRHDAGWQVNHKRVKRIWRQKGLRVPQKPPKRGRLMIDQSIKGLMDFRIS